ncbi:transaldolase [Patescibacteria group bacterium]|nr:transaldolase [Patescibacteria group bacterium]
MKPKNLQTKIFLDSGNPDETKKVIELLGFLDGQTTNPTLVSKNPEIAVRLKKGEKSTESELLTEYKNIVDEISRLIPDGSVSIEVYADDKTKAEEMLQQGKTMFSWIPNAHIKFPTTREGLAAVEQAIKKGMRINMTLCFTQEQAAAVYAATRGCQKGDVFVSPFIGRLDDQGDNGMDLIANIMKMYKVGDGHVELLTASVRKLDHLLYALQLGSDIITASFQVLKEWGEGGMPLPGDDFIYDSGNLKPILYKDIDLAKKWQEIAFSHELIDKGIEQFSRDWNKLKQ